MESSSSRVLLAIVASVAILFAWQFFFAPQPPQKTEGPQKVAQKEDGAKPASKTSPASSPASKPVAPEPAEETAEERARKEREGPRATTVEGEHTEVRTKQAVGLFTNRGAALRSWKLTNPQFKELKGGKLVQVDLVQTEPGKGPWPLTTTFVKSDFELPADASFEKLKGNEREVVYQWQSDKVRVQKHFVVDQARSVVWMTLLVRNLTQKKLRQRLQVSLYNLQDPNQGKAGFANPYPKISTILCHVNGELERRSAGAIRGEDSGCSAAGCGMGEGPVSTTGQVRWIGSDSRYFLLGLVPQDSDQERRCELKVREDNVIHASMLFSEGTIEPGGVMQRSFATFVGAKDLGGLDSLKGAEGQESSLSESIEFGWFAVLCRPMLWLLKGFYRWFGNWGIAIIMLTIIVKLLTLYWTQKSMRSMKAMQQLKPKIDELRAKFKDDKERLNQETMALYKVHKVNPLGGCLPMLIQMPVWFALYRTLGNAVELYRSSFVGWITDLTAPDPYYVLPIAMGVSMYAQQAITPQPMEGTQAKMMKYFMPGMFTVMMLWLPSGLTLYIFVNTVLTMIHQWYMNKTDPGTIAKGEAKKEPQTVKEHPKRGGGTETGRQRSRKKRRKKS
jgi:YidC/Oxa1 family membrane protein insertase